MVINVKNSSSWTFVVRDLNSNRYFGQSNGNKYLTLIPNDEGINTLKHMKNYGAK